MTKTYKIAEEIANEILNVRNARYEALFEPDGSPMLSSKGRIAFKWMYVKNVSKIGEEN